MERRICYPGTTRNVVDPFSVLTCTCGHRTWSLLSRPIECPKCGRMMSVEKKTAGYEGIGPEKGIFVPEDEAVEFAVDRGLHGASDEKQEFKDMVLEWFYSGNWIAIE